METGSGETPQDWYFEQEQQIERILDILMKRMELSQSLHASGHGRDDVIEQHSQRASNTEEVKETTRNLTYRANSLMRQALGFLSHSSPGRAQILVHTTLHSRVESTDRGFDWLEWRYYQGKKSAYAIEQLTVILNSQLSTHNTAPLLDVTEFIIHDNPASPPRQHFSIMQGRSYVFAMRSSENSHVPHYEPSREHPEELADFLQTVRHIAHIEW